MLSLLSLGSGSSGNSAVVYSENSYILVDAGLSAMQLKKRIMESGLDPQKLDAVLITHTHSDHVSGLPELRPFYWPERKKSWQPVHKMLCQ